MTTTTLLTGPFLPRTRRRTLLAALDADDGMSTAEYSTEQ